MEDEEVQEEAGSGCQKPKCAAWTEWKRRQGRRALEWVHKVEQQLHEQQEEVCIGARRRLGWMEDKEVPCCLVASRL